MSELEDNSLEKSDKKWEEEMNKTKKCPRSMWYNQPTEYACFSVSEGKEGETGLGEIVTDNFANLGKEAGIQVQEASGTPKRHDKKECSR